MDQDSHLADADAAGVPRGWSARDLVPQVVMFVITTLVIAVPYWTASYASIRDDGLFGSWYLVALVLVVGTVLAGSVGDAPLVSAVCLLGCAPVAVLGRVVIDTAAQPASHDLWPLEVVLAGMMSIPAVGIGVFLAWTIRRLSPQAADRP